MTSYEVARRYDNLLEQYTHSAHAALDKATPAPQPQGDTVPNLPVPVEWAGNVSTDNEDEGQMTETAPKDKGEGRDTQVAVHEEAEGVDTELGDSEKENNPDHPGVGWMHYEAANTEHYAMWIPMPGELGDTRAGYIRYVFNGEDTTLEGTFGKGHPVYRQPLRAQRADTRPNLTDNKDIRDDHLSAFNPESMMAEIIDRHVYHMADPGLIAEVVRYHTQKNRQGTLAACIKDLTEQQQRNNNALMNTTHSLIHAKAATRLIKQMFAEPPSHEELYKAYPFSICAGQGPANRLRHHPAQTPPDKRYSLYRHPRLEKPIFCYECFQTSPEHSPIECPDYGHCYFCTSTQHESLTCIAPHVRCEEKQCNVPVWHNYHSLQCATPAAACLAHLAREWPSKFLKRWDDDASPLTPLVATGL
jgi:hypothetical protein